MVSHISLPHHARLLAPFSFNVVFSFSLWCRPLFFWAAVFFFVIRETNEKQERKRASGLVSSHHRHPLYLSPHSFSFSILHLSVFLSDSWQPVGYSGHAKVQIFAKWLEKIHIWTWLTHACCGSSFCCSFISFRIAQTACALHSSAAHGSLWSLKHVRPQKACKWIRWDGLEAEAAKAAAIKLSFESAACGQEMIKKKQLHVYWF